MNYYPFHMGDYATATRHLSWDEDAAYRRLLDAYYTREAPLPADMRQVFRLVVASTPEQREAVDTVLNEFFELTDEGWVNRRADREIEAMREKQQKQRDKANAMWEKRRAGTRQSHSQEHGIASAMPMHTEEHAAASKTDADAMPPTPTPTPTPKKEEGEARKRAPAPRQPEGVSDQVWTDWLQLRKAKRAPVTQTVVDGAVREAGKAGMPVEAFLAVWCRRGSQGLEAAWLRPEERRHAVESFRERDARQAAEKVKAWTGGLCHDRKALGEERKPLPFEPGYAETVESTASVVTHDAPPSHQEVPTARDLRLVDVVVAKSHENAATGRISKQPGGDHEQRQIAL